MVEPPEDPLTSTAEAVDELRQALAGVGLTFPSLDVDLISCTQRDYPRPLVELGRCNLDTARRLSAVLRGAAR